MIFNIFRRKEINPFPISDKATFRNGDKTITLTVRREATSLIQNLKAVTNRLQGVTEETPLEEQREIALAFASCIFGEEQAQKLIGFYNDNPLATITACGMYFRGRLCKQITKAQKAK
jgi:hypothetical protein